LKLGSRFKSRAPWLLLLAVPACLYGLHRIEADPSGGATPVRAAGVVTSPFSRLATGAPADAVALPAPETGLSGPPETAIEERIGRGGTLAATIERLGISAGEGQRIIHDLSGHLDLRSLSPETGLRVNLDDDGRVRRLSIRAEPEKFVRLIPGSVGQAARVEVVELPTIDRVETGGGRIETSVHQALAGMPHSHELTLAYADIFQWDVDLLVEPRPGDEVRVVYEMLHLGDVPEDLPTFGNAASHPGEFLRLGRILAASYEGRLASSNAFLVERPDGPDCYYDALGRPLRKTFLKSPLDYRRISSRFSRARRHPITRRVIPHHGVDFAAAPGTPVVASADGRVVKAGWDGALGKAVHIRHGSEFVTVYGHLKGFAKGIKTGADVLQNEVIGYVGSTGRATGPHLHYTLKHHGQAIDPLKFRSPSVEPLGDHLRPQLELARREWEPMLGAIVTDVADGSESRTADPGA